MMVGYIVWDYRSTDQEVYKMGGVIYTTVDIIQSLLMRPLRTTKNRNR